jgi:hypothetical protein
MVVIILTAMLAGAFVGKILRRAEVPQPEIADQGTAPPAAQLSLGIKVRDCRRPNEAKVGAGVDGTVDRQARNAI